MIFRFKQAPHKVFLVSAILLTLFSLGVGNDDLDIILHDSYFVIRHSFILLAGLFIVIWGIYHFFPAMLPSPSLIALHVWGTFLPLCLTIIIPILAKAFKLGVDIYASVGAHAHAALSFVVAFIFVIAQISFLINLAKGVIKLRSKTTGFKHA